MKKNQKNEEMLSESDAYSSMGLTVSEVAGMITATIAAARKPAKQLPALLNYATAIRRPGFSPSIISSNIIQKNGKLGIVTGNNPDGTENVVNQFVENIIECVVKAIREDAVVEVTIPTGAITVQVEGGNAGGPVVAVGSNIIPVNVPGIIR